MSIEKCFENAVSFLIYVSHINHRIMQRLGVPLIFIRLQYIFRDFQGFHKNITYFFRAEATDFWMMSLNYLPTLWSQGIFITPLHCCQFLSLFFFNGTSPLWVHKLWPKQERILYGAFFLAQPPLDAFLAKLSEI